MAPAGWPNRWADASRYVSNSLGLVPSRSPRSSSMRARMLAKSSAARGRFRGVVKQCSELGRPIASPVVLPRICSVASRASRSGSAARPAAGAAFRVARMICWSCSSAPPDEEWMISPPLFAMSCVTGAYGSGRRAGYGGLISSSVRRNRPTGFPTRNR